VLRRLFRPNHATTVAHDIELVLADVRRMDARTCSDFWQAHTRLFLEQIIPLYARIPDDPGFQRQYVAGLGKKGVGEKEAVERALAEFEALAGAVAGFDPDELSAEHPDGFRPDELSVDRPDCFRCLVFSRIKTYAADGPNTITFAEEWDVYEEILAQHHLSPRS
jgi:hypothetical protein